MSAFTVGTTEVRVALRNSDRTSLVIINNHSTAYIYFKDSKGVTTSNGIPIYPRGNASITREDGDEPELDYWVISDTASTDVRIAEGYARK